jgi:hypothetical protein
MEYIWPAANEPFYNNLIESGIFMKLFWLTEMSLNESF